MIDNEKIIPIGSDHAGFELKEYLVWKLDEMGYTIIDYGTLIEESVDYPDFIHPVAQSIELGKYPKGIVICGSGQGANMTANKYPHVRSALCWNVQQAKLSRQHNDANIIAFPGRFIEKKEALEAVKVFLETEFEGGRHERRVKKISEVKV
jgi:ribose 5-phosphate isomerase B